MDNLRNYLQYGLAFVGTGLASLGSAGILPSEYAEAAAIGGGLAIIAIAEKLWRDNKETIVNELEDFVEDTTGLDIELDEVVDSVVEAGLDVATDIAEDGELDTPLSDVAEELAEEVAEDIAACVSASSCASASLVILSNSFSAEVHAHSILSE